MNQDGQALSLTTQCFNLCRQLATTGFSLFFDLNLEIEQEGAMEKEKKTKAKKKVPPVNFEQNIKNKEAFLRQKKKDALKYVELSSGKKTVSE